jgi:L-lactate dehydrogenase complex protein LldE
VESTDAKCLVACDAGCLMQMGGGLTRRGSRVRALHLAQVLEPGEIA